MSRLSASRSSPNLASSVTCSGETCSTSTAHFLKVSKASSAIGLGSPVVGPDGSDGSIGVSVADAEAAVDRQHGAGDVGGPGGREERHRGRHLLGGGVAAEGHRG